MIIWRYHKCFFSNLILFSPVYIIIACASRRGRGDRIKDKKGVEERCLMEGRPARACTLPITNLERSWRSKKGSAQYLPLEDAGVA